MIQASTDIATNLAPWVLLAVAFLKKLRIWVDAQIELSRAKKAYYERCVVALDAFEGGTLDVRVIQPKSPSHGPKGNGFHGTSSNNE